jgi:glucose/mannose-6-phosphate isomerase
MFEELDFKRLDQDRLYSIYEEWPKYFEDASRFSCKAERDQNYYNSVVFCGMGGSATSSDIIQEVMSTIGTIPAFTLRGQKMPLHVDERSLVVVNSVSGNTIEALLMMKEALNHNAEVICISSGGLLEQEAHDAKCKHIKIPNLCLPRASLPYLLIPGLSIISPFLKFSIKDECRIIGENIANIFNDIKIDVPAESNVAKKIANFLLEGFPFCYASPSLLPAVTRFKNSMNENAKLHCVRDSVLEASHNDIVPFTFSNTLQIPKVLHVRWLYDDATVSERFNKVRSLFEQVVHSVMEIMISDKSLLNALVSATYILDISTIYMAIAKNTDPSPTPAIQILKDL